MPKHFIDFAKRRLVQPVSSFLDTCADVFIAPGRVARWAEESHSPRTYWLAASFFVSAFSSGLGLSTIAFRALGIGSVDEILFWIFHLSFLALATALSFLFLVPLGLVEPGRVARGAAYSYGAAHFFGGLMLAGAAIAIGLLRYLNQIPSLKLDQSDWSNIEAVMQLVYRCKRDASLLFDILYQGLGGIFETLRFPIDWLSYVQPIAMIAGWFSFAAIVASSVPRRRWSAAFMVVLANVSAAVGTLALLYFHDDYLYRTTGCSEKASKQYRALTAPDFAEKFAKKAMADKRDLRGAELLSVQAQGLSIVYRYRIDPNKIKRDQLSAVVVRWRAHLIRKLCPNSLTRELGISWVTIVEYGAGGPKLDFVVGPAQCPK